MAETSAVYDHHENRHHGGAVVDWIADRVRTVRLVGHLDWITPGGLRQVLSGHCDEDGVIVVLDPAASIELSDAEVLLTAVSHAQACGTQFVIVSPNHSLTETLYATDVGFTVPVVRSTEAAMRIVSDHQARLSPLRVLCRVVRACPAPG